MTDLPARLASAPPAVQTWWIECRRFVDASDVRGLEVRIEHRVEFDSPEAAELFLEVADIRRYKPVGSGLERGDGLETTARVARTDELTADQLHNVVMELVELAAPYAGEYRMWGT